MKLKIKLWKTNYTVHMQVLEQVGIFESLSDKIRRYTAPSLFPDYIHLRGRGMEYDYSIANFICDTVQEAQSYLNKVISWLDDEFAGNPEPKEGDIVLAWNYKEQIPDKKIFLSKLKDGRSLCVECKDEKRYLDYNHDYLPIQTWKYMKSAKQSFYDPETQIWEWEG